MMSWYQSQEIFWLVFVLKTFINEILVEPVRYDAILKSVPTVTRTRNYLLQLIIDVVEVKNLNTNAAIKSLRTSR